MSYVVAGVAAAATIGIAYQQSQNIKANAEFNAQLGEMNDAQMQSELLRRSRLENLKDMQSSQVAAQMQSSQVAAQSRQRSSASSQTDLNASSALNFIGL